MLAGSLCALPHTHSRQPQQTATAPIVLFLLAVYSIRVSFLSPPPCLSAPYPYPIPILI